MTQNITGLKYDLLEIGKSYKVICNTDLFMVHPGNTIVYLIGELLEKHISSYGDNMRKLSLKFKFEYDVLTATTVYAKSSRMSDMIVIRYTLSQ